MLGEVGLTLTLWTVWRTPVDARWQAVSWTLRDVWTNSESPRELPIASPAMDESARMESQKERGYRNLNVR